jgi:hypothetical protein
VSELLPSIVKVLHGDLGCSWRSCLSAEIIALVSHDLGPKGFYLRKDKFGLEGIT